MKPPLTAPTEAIFIGIVTHGLLGFIGDRRPVHLPRPLRSGVVVTIAMRDMPGNDA